MDINKDDMVHVAKMCEGDGYRILDAWIQGRIDAITSKLINGESDLAVESVTKKKVGTKVEVTIISMSKDAEKHELRTWKMFRAKIADCKNRGL